MTAVDSDSGNGKSSKPGKLCDDELLKKDLQIKLNSPTMKEQSLQRQNSLQPEQQQSEIVVDNGPPQKVTVSQNKELSAIQKEFGELYAVFKVQQQTHSYGIGAAARYSRGGKAQDSHQDYRRVARDNDASTGTDYTADMQMTYGNA